MNRTHTSEFKFSGKKGIAVLLAVFAFVGYRFTSLGDVKDPVVIKVIEQELVTEWRRDKLPSLQSALQAGKVEQAGQATSAVLDPGLVIHKVRASRPLFSFASKQEVVYEVKYSMQGTGGDFVKKTRYYLFKHSLLSKPQLKWDTSQFRFYMNFF